MKKMTYLMMLVLGLTAVQTDAGIIKKIKAKFSAVKANTKAFAADFKAAKSPAEKLAVMKRHGKSAIDNNKQLFQELEAAVAAA